MSDSALDSLIRTLARLPGLGPRSARRVALALLQKKDQLMSPLIQSLSEAAATIQPCSRCGNLDSLDPCQICRDGGRDGHLLCVVEDVADLWALERARIFRGRYHVLGGSLSAIDGVGPEELRIDSLLRRLAAGGVDEVILALPATVDGQTTAHFVADRIGNLAVKISRLAHGVPVGGELDYLDDGTLGAALAARRPI